MIGRCFAVALLVLLPLDAAWSASPAAPKDPQVEVIAALIEAEFALQAGQLDAAAERYLAASRLANDAELAERATRIALAGSDRALARSALARWRQLAPSVPAVQAQSVTLALNDGEFETAMVYARNLLVLADDQGWPLLLRSLAESRGDARIIARAVLAALPDEAAMPGRIQPWLAFAGLARRLGDRVTSGRLVDHALARFPDDAEARLLQASQQRERGDAAGAQLALIAVLESPKSLPPALRRTAARELAEAGNRVRAAELLGRGEQSDEDYRLRASWLIAAEANAPLAALLEELRATSIALPMRALLLGHIAEALALWPEAERWYRLVEGAGADLASLRLTMALHRQGKTADAIALLHGLQSNENADGERVREAFLREAAMYAEAGDDAATMTAFQRGLAVFEDDPVLLYSRGLHQESQGRVDQALADLRRVLDQDADHAPALNAYGYTLAERRQRFEEARPFLERAYRLDPDSPAILDSLGWLRYRQGRNDEALALLQLAWAGQRDAEVAVHLGEVLWRLGRQEEARAVWRDGLALQPGHPALKGVLERMRP